MVLNKKSIAIILLILISTICGVIQSDYFLDVKPSAIESAINNTINQADEEITIIEKKILKGNFDSYSNQSNEFDVFIYNRSQVIYWSTNEYEIDSKSIFLNPKKISIVYSDYGVFLNVKKDLLQNTILISIPIFREFQLVNKYVKGGLNKNLFSGIVGDVNELKQDKSLEIKLNESLIFYLNVSKRIYPNKLIFSISILIFILLILYFFLEKHCFSSFFGIFILFTLRFILYIFNPEIKDLPLFEATTFASSLIQPNIFQLILNSIFVYVVIDKISINLKNTKYLNVLTFIYLLIVLIIINDLIRHSVLKFSPYNILTLQFDNLLIVFSLLINILLVSLFIWRIKSSKFQFLDYVFFIISLLFLYYIQGELAYFYLGLILVFYIIQIFSLSDFSKHTLTVLTLCLLISYQFAIKQEASISTERNKLINKFMSGNDPYIEYLINEVSERIANDKIIISRLKSPFYASNQFVIDKINKVYLEKYFSGYEIEIDIISIDQIFRNENKLQLREIKYNSKLKSYTDLYQIKSNEIGVNDYLKIVCFNDDRLVKNVSLRFKNKPNSKYSILPKLLVNEGNHVLNDDLFDYKLLENGNLILQKGVYNIREIEDVLNDENFRTILFNLGNKKLYITNKDNFFHNFLNAFSLIIILIILIYVILLFIFNLLLKNNTSLIRRMQVSFILVVMLSFVITLIAVVTSIKTNYTNNLNENNIEKAKQIGSQIEKLLSINQYNKIEIESDFFALSSIYNVDLNLFNSKGELIISTLPELYDKMLKSYRIDFSILKKYENYILKDRIDKIEFNTAISPILNSDNKHLGYITIPFFNGEDLLKDRIDQLSYSIIKVSLVLLMMILFITYLLSKSITKPILELSQKIGNISFENEEKPLKWSNNDELGILVRSYNEMLLKLKESKSRLQMKEKQEAWKEMAQQVAHEIKNPLTPMKLSLQFMMQKLKSDRLSNIDIEKTTKSMLLQVDNLTEIVTSFSQFATMPDYKFTNEDISKILINVSTVYEDTADLSLNLTDNCIVRLDEKAFSGIISNLIINGIQSVKNKKPIITIESKIIDNKTLIGLSDNGEGISEEIKGKVFTPNFSTKYSGSGIGLALAKQGIEEFKGKIWFETKVGVGTTFYIELPLSK